MPFLILAALMLVAEGCGIAHQHRADRRQQDHLPAQSWDQENLKRNDTANCETGNPVFIAPNGDLTQCF